MEASLQAAFSEISIIEKFSNNALEVYAILRKEKWRFLVDHDRKFGWRLGVREKYPVRHLSYYAVRSPRSRRI